MKHARAKCLLGCLVLLAPGCGLLTSTSVKTMLEKGDDSGQNRLVIRSVETVKLLNRNNPTYEFDSLVWQTKDGSDWKDKVVLRGASASRRRREASLGHGTVQSGFRKRERHPESCRAGRRRKGSQGKRRLLVAGMGFGPKAGNQDHSRLLHPG